MKGLLLYIPSRWDIRVDNYVCSYPYVAECPSQTIWSVLTSNFFFSPDHGYMYGRWTRWWHVCKRTATSSARDQDSCPVNGLTLHSLPYMTHPAMAVVSRASTNQNCWCQPKNIAICDLKFFLPFINLFLGVCNDARKEVAPKVVQHTPCTGSDQHWTLWPLILYLFLGGEDENWWISW